MSDARPNLLFVLTDQHRLDHISAYRDAVIPTPHFDRIAEGGVTFERAYTACPLCSPARATIMSGRYPHSVGVPTNTHRGIQGPSEGEVLVSQLLSDAGYRCGYSGKWHVSKDADLSRWGFEHTIGTGRAYVEACRREGISQPDLSPESPHRFQVVARDGKEYTFSAPPPGRAPYPAEWDYDSFVADEAVRFLESHGRSPQPFALWCSFHGPHPPFVIPEPYYSRHDPESIPPPPNFVDPPEDLDGWHGTASAMNGGFLHWGWTDWQPAAAAYRGSIDLIDDGVGRLLDALEATGRADETLIVFTTDHGEMLGSHRLWQKSNMYEEAVHIPLLLRPPGGCEARRASDLVGHADLAPTILEYCGLAPKQDAQGYSLHGLIERGEPGPNEAVFAEWNPGEASQVSLRMVCTERHKYVYFPGGEDVLYDLESDPHELHNAIEDCPDVVADCQRRLAEWQAATEDELPPPG